MHKKTFFKSNEVFSVTLLCYVTIYMCFLLDLNKCCERAKEIAPQVPMALQSLISENPSVINLVLQCGAQCIKPLSTDPNG